MARPFNPNCASCGVPKDDANTARVKARGGAFDAYCRACRKRLRRGSASPSIPPAPRVKEATREHVEPRRYNAAMVRMSSEQSQRDLEITLRAVADQPHRPWTNIAACRECARELGESITYGLDRQQGKAGAPPRTCLERIQAQARAAHSQWFALPRFAKSSSVG